MDERVIFDALDFDGSIPIPIPMAMSTPRIRFRFSDELGFGDGGVRMILGVVGVDIDIVEGAFGAFVG